MWERFVMRDDVLLRGLKNIGPTIAARFEAVGIKTVGDLRAIVPAEAYKRVKAAHAGMTLPECYYLYSLQGALDGVHWDALSRAVKEKLLADAGIRLAARRAGQRFYLAP
jgi:DNA transformation protein and related proteins